MKVLFLVSRFPYPLTKGDKLRAYHQLRMIAQEHKVILVCLSDTKVTQEAMDKVSPYCEELHLLKLNRLLIGVNLFRALFSELPFQVHYFYQKRLQRKIDRIVETHLPAHIFCQLVRCSEYVRKYEVIPSTLDYMDAFSIGILRRIPRVSFLLKPIYRSEYVRLKHYEALVFKHFKHKAIISEQDRDLIEHPKREEIHILKNGVDFEFFAPRNVNKTFDISFVGNMSYPPNIKAAQYLALKIVPLLLKDHPNLKVLIAGAQPVAAVRRLQSRHITVRGWVPDIRESYWKSRVFCAPMSIGTGLQNKLLEAMACGLPCVTTPLANQALKAIQGEEILVGTNARELTAHIATLLNNESFSHKLANAGFDMVRRKYGWSNNAKKLLDLIENEKIGTGVDYEQANNEY